MTMPETAMHEDNRTMLRKHNVRPAGEVFSVQPVSVAERVEQRANPHFRPAVPGFDSRHVPAALFGGVNVDHG
jgi:hypothetical protein